MLHFNLRSFKINGIIKYIFVFMTVNVVIATDVKCAKAIIKRTNIKI